VKCAEWEEVNMDFNTFLLCLQMLAGQVCADYTCEDNFIDCVLDGESTEFCSYGKTKETWCRYDPKKDKEVYVINDMADYLEQFIGTPYTWGGSTAEEGLDCSGLIQLGLKAWGLLPYAVDYNSQSFYEVFIIIHKETKDIARNNLLFFGKSKESITHVAMALNSWQMIEAAGEGRKANTKGSVRVMPIAHRKDLVAVINIGEF